MIFLIFFALFIVVPIAELWLILEVGSLIGTWPTILLLIADSIIGAWLVRSQGSQVWQRFTRTIDSGKVPANEAVDGFFVILGGTLLLVPGFLSDIAGLVFILPPTRKLMRGRVVNYVRRRTRATFVGGFVADDDSVRDFAHSDQPRRRTSSTQGEREPEFDFETHQLHE
ncbi:MAG: FxsA family protein [Solirubrobacterales bacterium]